MKFLLIINNDIDGVGQPAINLCSNLKKEGHVSKIITLHKFTKNKDIIKVNRSLILRLLLTLLNVLKKDYSELFGFGYSTINYRDIKKHVDNADIIIIYTFYKIISNEILHKILSSKKIVYFRPCDIELASGGCHFNEECKKYKSNCKYCPKLNFLDIFNLPKTNLVAKKKIFEYFKPRVFVQNNYVRNIFKSSATFRNIKTNALSLGADPKRTKFYSKKSARKVLGIDSNEKIILFGAFNLESKIKGGHLLKASLKIFESKFIKNKFTSNNISKVRLITIGNKYNFNPNTSKIKWTHLGLINSNKKLNLLYRSADVLVCPSLYCFGPHIVTEAISNDLPVVGFNLGTAQGSIINGINGYVVPCYDILIFAESIYKILFSKRKKNHHAVINKIKSNCSSSNEANYIIRMATTDLSNTRKQ